MCIGTIDFVVNGFFLAPQIRLEPFVKEDAKIEFLRCPSNPSRKCTIYATKAE